MQDTPTKPKCKRYSIIFVALLLTLLTLILSISLSAARVEYHDKSGSSESYPGNFQDCQYDEYGPIKTTQESRRQDEGTIISTCPWRQSITRLSYMSFAITVIFIGSLCFNFRSNSKSVLITMFLSGLTSTALLGMTFVLMEMDIQGSTDPANYQHGDFKVTFSKKIYNYHALIVGATLIIVGALWYPETGRCLRELKRTGYQLPDDVPHIELAEEAGSTDCESQSKRGVQEEV